MSVSAALGKVKHAGKDLRAQWQEARAAWYDENSRLFEQNNLTPLLAQLRRTELTMAHMAAVLYRLRRDCE